MILGSREVQVLDAFKEANKDSVCEWRGLLLKSRVMYELGGGLVPLTTPLLNFNRMTDYTGQHVSPAAYNSFFETSFFDVIDKEATRKAFLKKLADYQKEKYKNKRGGFTAITIDIMYAIMRAIPYTMEDIKIHQEGLFAECVEHGEYFCFTTSESLATMANNTQEYKQLRCTARTVRNHIVKLIDAGIITEKVNFSRTERINGNYRNPYPSEQNSAGRGKYQLWISPEVLCLKPQFAGSAASDSTPFFAHNQQTFPLDRTTGSLPIKEKELKSITNTVKPVNKAASAVAELNPSNIGGKEQGSKPKPAPKPKNAPKTFSKKHFQLHKLWQLAKFELWPDLTINETAADTCKIAISEFLAMAQDYVEAYRKQKIQAFCQNPAYLASKRPNAMLKRFAVNLPDVNRAAIEIISHAFWKQKKHASKKGYSLYYPVDYFESAAMAQAYEYSLQDWRRIQENYFNKNKASKAYFEQIRWINGRYSAAMEQITTIGAAKAHENSAILYKDWINQLNANIYLNENKINILKGFFISKFKTLFNDTTTNSQNAQARPKKE